MRNCCTPFRQLHDGSLAPPTSHAIATHAITFVDAGEFPEGCAGMSVRVERQDCAPTNAVQERAPERATKSATNSTTIL